MEKDPSVSHLAREFRNILATLVPSEQLFGIICLTISKQQTSPDPGVAESIMNKYNKTRLHVSNVRTIYLPYGQCVNCNHKNSYFYVFDLAE